MAGRIVIRRDDSGTFRFNVLDDDGTVFASSKGFPSAEAARGGADRVRELTADARIVDQTESAEPVRAEASLTDPHREA